MFIDSDSPLNSSNASLGKIQRVFLLLIALAFSVLLFFLKGGLTSQAPLDELARESLNPYLALSNGKPTVIEFYADWCEVCREMAPMILSVEKKFSTHIDFVLLNVDNPEWLELLDEYQVTGIPQFNFFDETGLYSFKAIGRRSDQEFLVLINTLLKNELPDQKVNTNFIEQNLGFSPLPRLEVVSDETNPRSHG